MTINEIVFDIKERMQIGSDDRSQDFPELHILHIYEECRATILSQRLNRSGRMVDTELYQTVRLEMEMVDRSFCPQVPIGCKILRSKLPIASDPLNLHNHALVDRIGGNDILSKKYKYVEYSDMSNIFGGRFAHKYVYGFLLRGHLYLTSKNKMVNALGNIVMRAVFEQPSKIVEANQCVENCDSYPIKQTYQDQIVKLTINKLISKYQIPEDGMNDAANIIQQPVKNASQES